MEEALFRFVSVTEPQRCYNTALVRPLESLVVCLVEDKDNTLFLLFFCKAPVSNPRVFRVAYSNIDTTIVFQEFIKQLLEILDGQAESASQLLEVGLESLDKPIVVVFMPRVLGHGGFASQEISVSYLDRNYAGRGTPTVLHHEIVHVLDGHLGGGLRPTILIEGLAVYLSGGHFKPEPLMPRAAALLPPEPGCAQAVSVPIGQVCGLDWYIPMDELVDDFYLEQHEISYLEAGALVEFMASMAAAISACFSKRSIS